MISPVHKDAFDQNGFCIFDSFLSSSEIAALKNQAAYIVQSHDLELSRTVFSTNRAGEDPLVNANDYFLDSDNSVRCFFEEKAFDETGRLNQALELSINKIGHALHTQDPVFHDFCDHPGLDAIARGLGQDRPEIRQSMYIFKQPRIGGEVHWHQDGSFFYTVPNSVLTFWFALDDATLENGCLWAEPGGHISPLRERFVRNGRQIDMKSVDPMPWPEFEKAAPLEVKAGTLICFHGHLPHYSAENTSDHPRHAFTLHVTDGACAYAAENWIQSDSAYPVRGFID